MTDAPAPASDSASQPLRIGISSCLLGEKVRYDGGHKRDSFLIGTLGPYVEWVPVCPEVELGLGTPRPTMRLIAGPAGPSLVTVDARRDHTEAMRRYAERRVAALAGADLSGYVLKKDSPSCGMERVRIYGEKGPPARNGRGLFAAALMARLPHLPVEEEGRLNDARLRDNFIERVFAYRRLRSLFDGRWRRGDVTAFHTAHKLQLLAHSPPAYEALGRLAARIKQTPREELRRRYADVFMTALAEIAQRRRHVNVLQHMGGYFRDDLDRESRRELEDMIQDYRRGLVPLIVPMTLVRHHVRHLDVRYLQGQTYLAPHPKELMLRNHV